MPSFTILILANFNYYNNHMRYNVFCLTTVYINAEGEGPYHLALALRNYSCICLRVIFKIDIPHTVFTNFAYTHEKNSAHQTQNNIITTLTEVDNLHTLNPLSLHHRIKIKLFSQLIKTDLKHKKGTKVRMLNHLTERDYLSEGSLRYPIYSSITIFPSSHYQKGNGGKMIFLHNTLIIYRALFHTTRINFVAFYLMKKNKLCLKYKRQCIMFQGPLQT